MQELGRRGAVRRARRLDAAGMAAVLTTESVGLLTQVHERMPLGLARSALDAWLDRRRCLLDAVAQNAHV